jgi:hypothetical protein
MLVLQCLWDQWLMISNVGLCATWESADHSWQELTESMSWTPKGTEQWKKAPPSEPSFSSDKLAQSGKRNINQCYASANCLPIICGHEDRWVQPWHVYISTGKASSLRNKKNIEAWHNKTKGKHESRNKRKQRPLQKIASKDRFAEGILGFHSCPALQMHARL